MSAFNPLGNTTLLFASSTSSNTALHSEGNTLLIRNYGPDRAYARRGANTVNASAVDYPIEPFTADYIYRNTSTHTHVALICNLGASANISLNCGDL